MYQNLPVYSKKALLSIVENMAFIKQKEGIGLKQRTHIFYNGRSAFGAVRPL